jgi:hypothetical protein
MSLLNRIRKLEQSIKPHQKLVPLICVWEQEDGSAISKGIDGTMIAHYTKAELEAYGEGEDRVCAIVIGHPSRYANTKVLANVSPDDL